MASGRNAALDAAGARATGGSVGIPVEGSYSCCSTTALPRSLA
jgi:hypothetical protein